MIFRFAKSPERGALSKDSLENRGAEERTQPGCCQHNNDYLWHGGIQFTGLVKQ